MYQSSEERASTTGRRASPPLHGDPDTTIRTPRTWVEVANCNADLEPFVGLWERLAREAIEPNVYYEPWQLRPAIEAFGQKESFALAFVLHTSGATKGETIAIGFFPFIRRSQFRGWPVHILRAWDHEMAPLTLPLLHSNFLEDAWSAVLDHFRNTSLLEFPLLPAEGWAWRSLVGQLWNGQLLTYEAERFTRAFLVSNGTDGRAYTKRTISPRVLKELRRQRNRLRDAGSLQLRTLEEDGDVAKWIDDFISLERSGWKGVDGTGLGSSSNGANYFRSICHEAFSRRRLHMLGLFLDGEPLAMKCNFLAGNGAFALKIAYDETYAKLSPGTQLELDSIVDVHRRGNIAWMDSCAVPGHPMIDHLWGERRAIVHLLAAPGNWRGALLTGVFPLIRAVKRLGRGPSIGARVSESRCIAVKLPRWLARFWPIC